ncbi:MAG: type II/IV secretion system protein [Chloroflexi bacterium]|nr:type II/IV secretion system protein [Chloroflexota bacterium]
MVSRTTPSFEERVGQVLLEGGFITQEQLDDARTVSEKESSSLLDAMVSHGMLAQETLVTVLSFQLRIPVVDLRHVQVDPEAVALVPEEYARQHGVMPTGFDTDGSLRIATRMPNDFQLSTQLSSMTGRQTKFALALSGDLDELIDRTYARVSVEQAPIPDATAEPQLGSVMDVISTPQPSASPGGLMGQSIAGLPAAQAIEMVTLQAVKRKASDVHLVPSSDSAKVMFRVDGVLTEIVVVPITLHESMLSRVKVLAEMDISETRRPQDGSFTLTFNEKSVDFRVSSIGTTWGEMMVIRVLDRSDGILSLEEAGLEDMALHQWRQLLSMPYGMLLVSGPTGSGKTTTLYGSIMELTKDRGNIMTVEDPVEYRMEDLNQIEVNRSAGIDFAAGLRSIVRLDPDIILVGEVRDAETAKVAVDAALTGHLVLASIHANDASSSLVRLLDLGIERYLAATAVAGSLAQRLVRKTCPHCKIPTELTAMEAMAYEAEMQEPAGEFMVGPGCNFCEGNGYIGRIGVFEVMSISDPIRKLIAAGSSGQEMRAQALTDGMVPLRRAGMLKAQEGVTSVGEVLRKVFFMD